MVSFQNKWTKIYLENGLQNVGSFVNLILDCNVIVCVIKCITVMCIQAGYDMAILNCKAFLQYYAT